VTKTDTAWQVYRTRFLIRATQLTEAFSFVDPLGREHSGQPGDYLVESSDGTRRIAPREIFEDIYVPIGFPDATWSPPIKRELTFQSPQRRPAQRRSLMV
jgi:hypothetical protein